jgi:hypothetical protein
MANRDVVVSHQNVFDHEAYDSLAFSDIQRFSSTAQAREECREGLGQTQECSPIVDLVSDRLQLCAEHLFPMA